MSYFVVLEVLNFVFGIIMLLCNEPSRAAAAFALSCYLHLWRRENYPDGRS